MDDITAEQDLAKPEPDEKASVKTAPIKTEPAKAAPIKMESAKAVSKSAKRRASLAIIAALAALVLSDFLFWKQPLGISTALYCGTLAIAVFIVNFDANSLSRQLKAGVILIFAIAPLIEAVTPLSLFFAASGMATYALLVTGHLRGFWPAICWQPIELLCVGPFRFIPDMASSDYKHDLVSPIANLVVWIVPVLLSLVFLLLFASANPMIDEALSAIKFENFWALLSFNRIIFWFLTISIAWGFIRARRASNGAEIYKPPAHQPLNQAENHKPKTWATALFGPAAILRSLILFNLIFAVQTGLDTAFLWSGADLPVGMTYASYAHRGAYPLIVTVLLAALFIVVSFAPGREHQTTPLARVLVVAWIAQNLGLLGSTFERMRLYVDVYSLSYWRVAVFIWLGLIAVGFVLIAIRIVQRRSNAWLIGANLAVTLAVLYACCFVNFTYLISTYNAEHNRLVSGWGAHLDGGYLAALGPHAIPAMDRFEALKKITSTTNLYVPLSRSKRCSLAWSFEQRFENWRAWTFRGARLLQYLNNNPGGCD